jgi:hypothetical protein
MENKNETNELWEVLKEAVIESLLVKLILSKPRKKQSGLRRLSLRPVSIKGALMLQFTEHYERREIVKNVAPDDALAIAKTYFDNHFLEANLFTAKEHLHLLTNLKGNQKILRKPLKEEATTNLSHDKSKKRLIDPSGFHWHKLGLTDAKGVVLPSMQFKFKQIHQYIAILQPMLEPLLKHSSLHIADMGAGKGYLTFALYEYLKSAYKGQLLVTGVEQRDELVDLTTHIAKFAGFESLRFVKGEIGSYDASGTDVLIALHACDTATDDAIASGIRAGARLIVCAPCCHKQVRNAMLPPSTMPMLNYGILWERQAEILTDTLRALIMEKYGYKSHIQEFIDMGHTPKNLLLTGIKVTKEPDIDQIEQKIFALKAQFGVQKHYLEELLEKIE